MDDGEHPNCGADAVIAGVIERAGEVTGGSTRLRLREVIASDTHALALVDWSRVVEGWFFPEDPAASDAFFAGGNDG